MRERLIRRLFTVSLWLKGANALSEIVAGIGTLLIPQQKLLAFTIWITRNEFAEDPRDRIATSLLHAIQHLSLSSQSFVGIYLLAHGLIKLWLIVGLLSQRLWYYPVAILVFALFIFYQLYRYTHTNSVWLLILSALDAIVIALTWHEYRFLRNRTE